MIRCFNNNSYSKKTQRMTDKTISEQAQELRSKEDDKIEAWEMQIEIDRDYLEEIQKVTRREPASDWITPYYIVCLRTKPSWGINVIRRRFWARQTCPKPVPSQTVYRYYPNSGNLELLWTLPNIDAINYVSQNRDKIENEFKSVIPYVVKYLEKKLPRQNEI